jgi:hypothetical protein
MAPGFGRQPLLSLLIRFMPLLVLRRSGGVPSGSAAAATNSSRSSAPIALQGSQ